MGQAMQLSQNQDASDARNHAYELDTFLKSNDDCDLTIPSYELGTAESSKWPTVGSIANMETLGVLIKAQ